MASEVETLEDKKLEDLPNIEEEVELKDMEESEKEDEEEQETKENEGTDGEEADERKESSKKGSRSSKKAKIDSSPVTPTERPTRERKTVERYTESMSRLSSPKPFSIEKGSGTQLKDIPNVAYKLSKRKPDEILQSMHTILFNKRAKVNTLKKNIGMFSGFVWADDEQGKLRMKVKEKLDKCTKEKLFDFCDVLNLQINKSSLKKEDVSLKLLEFLQSPHATTEVLLAEKEQKSKKRKAKARKSRTPSTKQSGEKRKRQSKTQEEETNMDEDENSESEADESHEVNDENTPLKPKNDDEEDKSEEGSDEQEHEVEEEDKPEKKITTEKSSSKKNVKKDSGTKTVEKNNVKVTNKSDKKSKKDTDKKDSAKDIVKGKGNKKAKAEPTKEEMHAVVDTILKEVDFNTATLSDIIKQLGTHFGQDLLHRKAEVKAIITDVINNMSGDDDEEEEGGSDDEDGDEDNDS